MNKRVDYLIISNKNDFTSDYICVKLHRLRKSYVRINRDEFASYQIAWNVNKNRLTIGIQGVQYLIEETLRGVYFRAPVYIRYYERSTWEEQLYKSQWMAFIKNLMCFEKAIWINHPVATYKAENKMLQLKYAQELGFLIPQTWVTNGNSLVLENDKYYAVKSIDTLLLRQGNKEAFLYTNIMRGKEITKADLALAPIVVQEFLNPKIDLRVTVVGTKVYAVKILQDGKGTYGDWRRAKDDVKFVKVILPEDINNKCIALVQKLGLIFGGIDLALVKGSYYFVEINPTGEWAWLVESAGLEINWAITMCLIGDVYGEQGQGE